MAKNFSQFTDPESGSQSKPFDLSLLDSDSDDEYPSVMRAASANDFVDISDDELDLNDSVSEDDNDGESLREIGHTRQPLPNSSGRLPQLLAAAAQSATALMGSETAWSTKPAGQTAVAQNEVSELTLAEMNELLLGNGMRSPLKPHQLEGVKFIYRRTKADNRGCLLADGMGLGKTIESLAAYVLRRYFCKQAGRAVEPLLVVCPKSVALQWSTETTKHTSLQPGVYMESWRRSMDLKDFDVIITTYNIVMEEVKRYAIRKKSSLMAPVPSDIAAMWIPSKRNKERDSVVAANNTKKARAWIQNRFNEAPKWDMVVLDEAHKARNLKTSIAKSILMLAAQSRAVVCATGTPFNNSVKDIATLCAFIAEGEYQEARWWQKNELNDQLVGRWRTEYLLFRPKSILNLPPITQKYLTFPLDESEFKLYDIVFLEFQKAVDVYQQTFGLSKFKAFAHVLVWLLRLRQSVSHPMLITGGRVHTLPYAKLAMRRAFPPHCVVCMDIDPKKESALFDQDEPELDVRTAITLPCGDVVCSEECRVKADAECPVCAMKKRWVGKDSHHSTRIRKMLEHIQECIADGSKLVLFSQWTSFLDLCEDALMHTGIPYLRFDGDMSADQRNVALGMFSDHDQPHKVLLTSIQAGGVGINITSANHVLFADMWYNPMVEEQARDRVHRIGQTKPVSVTWMQAENTIDDAMIKLQARKRNGAQRTLAGIGSIQGNIANGVNAEEVLSILGHMLAQRDARISGVDANAAAANVAAAAAASREQHRVLPSPAFSSQQRYLDAVQKQADQISALSAASRLVTVRKLNSDPTGRSVLPRPPPPSLLVPAARQLAQPERTSYARPTSSFPLGLPAVTKPEQELPETASARLKRRRRELNRNKMDHLHRVVTPELVDEQKRLLAAARAFNAARDRVEAAAAMEIEPKEEEEDSSDEEPAMKRAHSAPSDFIMIDSD
eukprot:TRINITY_DN1646_c0_g1_i1.p1 TRINITY_DN1646_c0_g1~~TRINITY_DN1646_c0_g1_i1.p1  ORF type:complete len:955 (+),score=182.95 TRINITY_DN1646_c0_g1_i1:65-2929(+)